MKRLDGHLTISRVTSNQDNDYIEIRVEDVKAGIYILKASIGFAEFAKVITAFPQKCLVEFNDSVLIGKKKEHKIVAIEVPEEIYSLSDSELRECLSEHEVDGWVGRVSDLKNPNRRSDGKCNNVSFERWV